MNKSYYQRYFANMVGISIVILPIVGLVFALNQGLFANILNQSPSNQDSIETQPEPDLPKPEKIKTTISIKAVGDIVAGTNFPDYRLPKNPDILFPQAVRQKLQGADVLFGNYESTLTNHPHSSKNVGRGMVFAFRSPPSYSKLFAQVGFHVMSVANNHSFDFGLKGFQDTVASLKSVGIAPVGEKNQITYTQIKGVPVAWIGFCFYEYCNTVQNIPAGQKLVETAKQNADIVIVSMHVGAEGNNALRVKNQTEMFYGENRGNSRQFARAMVDAGADLVLGHGPHVPRAMEVYKNKLIAYSLGNFLGYRTFSTTGAKGKSLILEAKINQDGDFVEGQIIPIQLNRQGIPQVDNSGQTISLVRNLTKTDFPQTPIVIQQKGEIRLTRGSGR